MAASSPHVAVTRLAYSTGTPAESAAPSACSGVYSMSSASACLSPSATGRGLNTQAPAPYRVPESHVALPFAPSPALVASLTHANRGGGSGAQAARR